METFENSTVIDTKEGTFTTLGAPSGIKGTSVQELNIYPNPAKDELFITSELLIKKVEVYSITGSLLLSDNNFNEKISVSTLPQGVYMVKVYTNEGLAVRKIVKE